MFIENQLYLFGNSLQKFFCPCLGTDAINPVTFLELDIWEMNIEMSFKTILILSFVLSHIQNMTTFCYLALNSKPELLEVRCVFSQNLRFYTSTIPINCLVLN